MNKNSLSLVCLSLVCLLTPSGNPIFPGWYADPETAVYDNTYWVYPTYSAPYISPARMIIISSIIADPWAKQTPIIA